MPNLNINKKKKANKNQITITQIHYSKLKRGKYQYADASNEYIEESFVNSIMMGNGVRETLTVRKVGVDAYEILSGHKRVLACKYITEILKIEGFEMLPCDVKDVDDVTAEMLTYVLNDRYEETHDQKIHKINRTIYLIKNHPESVPNLPDKGRMVEKLSQILNMSLTDVKTYLNIERNLSDKGKEALASGELTKTGADKLAGLPQAEQDELLEAGITTVEEIKEIKKAKKLEGVDVTSPSDENDSESAEVIKGQFKVVDLDMNMIEDTGEETLPSTIEYDTYADIYSSLLDEYGKWNIWCENPITEEIFYKHDYEDGIAIVVKEYPYLSDNQTLETRVDYYFIEDGMPLANGFVTSKESLIYRLLNE